VVPLASHAAAPDWQATYASGSALLSAPCLDGTVALSVEESRLGSALADNSNPAVLQSTSFARQMIDGAGFEGFGLSLVNALCKQRDLAGTQQLLSVQAQQLWRNAVDRAQQRGPVKGSLPYSDDRPLYWTRLQATAALRQWQPNFKLSADQRTALIESFDRTSRGMFDINFPAGKGVKRLIMSGFDPYTLDGGTTGSATGAVGNNIRHGNPSGATALSLDGTTYKAKDGSVVFIEGYTLPVNYPEFERGYLEDTVGPFMEPGPRQVNASVTVSQAGPYEFDLEMWNGRYHGVSLGNDNFAPCRTQNGVPQLAINNECDILVVDRWGGPPTFDLRNRAQFTTTSLPFAAVIAANTGRPCRARQAMVGRTRQWRSASCDTRATRSSRTARRQHASPAIRRCRRPSPRRRRRSRQTRTLAHTTVVAVTTCLTRAPTATRRCVTAGPPHPGRAHPHAEHAAFRRQRPGPG
jgi:hypothetical protein